MPKKKITITEALNDFNKILQGTGLTAKLVPIEEKPLPDIFVKEGEEKVREIPKKVTPSNVKITLCSRHSIAKGGSLVEHSDGTTAIEGNTVESYGPGICIVPSEYVEHLLHQDMLAQQADEKFLDREHKQFIIGPVRHGNRQINALIRVDEDSYSHIMNPNDNSLNPYLIRIR